MSTGRETGQNSGLMNASIDGTTIGEALREWADVGRLCLEH